jgi:hypothetical protein
MKNRILYLVIAVLVVVLLFSTCQCSRNRKVADSNLAAATDTVKYYKNKLGSVTASKQTLQLDNTQLKKVLLEKDRELFQLSKEFLKLRSIAKYNTTTTLPGVPIIYRDTIPCIFERTGEVNEKWYSFIYQSNQNGFKIDSLSIPNTATVITGTKRKWFLGKETLTTDVTNTNPYVKVTSVTAAEIDIPAPWYKKWYVWFAAGIAGGMFIAN